MLNPRRSDLWTRCPAAALPADPDVPPDPPGELAAEFTAVEWAVSCLLYGGVLSAEELVGRHALTADLARIAADYVDVARHWSPRATEHEGLEICAHPTPRVALVSPGWRPVEAGTNPYHLYAASECFRGRDVIFTVYQPRPHHPDGEWREVLRTAEWMDGWRAWYDGRAAAASEAHPVASPGDHCGRCLRRSRCPAAAYAVYADRDALASRAPGSRMDGWELCRELDFLAAAEAALEARASGVRAEAEARIRAGEFVPWWTMSPGNGKRTTSAGPEAVRLLTGLDPYKHKLKSPSELEREGAPEEVVRTLSRYDAGAPRLTRITPAQVARMFKR